MPQVYASEQLRVFFASLAAKESKLALTFELILKTGLLEQEAVYLRWKDVDLTRGILRIRSNPTFGFIVKDKEQREITIPADLLTVLDAQRALTLDAKLVCGNIRDEPELKLLRHLKRLSKAAKLNCGDCAGCQSRGECESWFLHKFRATYITTLLRSDMDLRTVMKLSGHSDLASVMRYLAPAGDVAIRAHISTVSFM